MCKREWRALVWAAEREIHEWDSAGDDGGGGLHVGGFVLFRAVLVDG